MENPGALVVARVPSVSVPVCVSVSAPTSVKETPCASEEVCEWCVHECAGVRASRHAVCERGTAGGRDHVRVGGGTCVRTPLCK